MALSIRKEQVQWSICHPHYIIMKVKVKILWNIACGWGHIKWDGCGEVCKDDTARTFVNCSQLKRVWINSRLLLLLLLLFLYRYTARVSGSSVNGSKRENENQKSVRNSSEYLLGVLYLLVEQLINTILYMYTLFPTHPHAQGYDLYIFSCMPYSGIWSSIYLCGIGW